VLQKPVPALAFFALSLVSTSERRAFPLRVEQVVRTQAEKAARQAQAPAPPTPAPSGKRPPGRPKGSKNQKKDEVTLSPELQRIQAMIQAALPLLARSLALPSLALEGPFAHHAALQMTRRCGLHRISQLRSDAALFFPYEGPPPPRGPRRK
jgi:putative transposase